MFASSVCVSKKLLIKNNILKEKKNWKRWKKKTHNYFLVFSLLSFWGKINFLFFAKRENRKIKEIKKKKFLPSLSSLLKFITVGQMTKTRNRKSLVSFDFKKVMKKQRKKYRKEILWNRRV